MKICNNTVIVVGIVSAAIVGGISIVTGHDQLDLTLSIIAGLATGAPHIPALYSKVFRSAPDAAAPSPVPPPV